jgi:hypothetical protein
MSSKSNVLSLVRSLAIALAFLTLLICFAEVVVAAPRTAAWERQASQASQAPLFLPPVNYLAGPGGPASIAVADVNGDGIPDLIVANCIGSGDQPCGGEGAVGVLLGKGDGTFQPVVTYDAGKYGSMSVAVGDLNGDGKPDLVVANPCTTQFFPLNCPSDGSVTVLLGKGDGTFQSGVAYDSGGISAQSVALADFDGDGNLDVVVANLGFITGRAITLLRGNGDGTLQPAVTLGDTAGFVTTADVNGDGRADIVFLGTSPFFQPFESVGVLLGNGDGTFQPGVTYSTGATDPNWVAVADVNHDGKPDLVVSNLCQAITRFNCGGIPPGEVGILIGHGDGTFDPVVLYSSGGHFATSVAVADINGDGNADVVVGNLNSSTVGVLLGNGDGTFQPATTFKAGLHPYVLAVADLNRDGRPDIVSYGYSPLAVAVLLNRSGAQPTSTALESNLNPAIYRQKITFTAAVPSSGAIPPTGKVTFQGKSFSGTFGLGSAMLNGSGVATVTQSYLNAGAYSVSAVYTGDINYLGSTSVALNQTVTQATSAATITSSANPSSAGQAVTFTASITSSTVTPTGIVTFSAGENVLGTATLSHGKATLSVSSLSVGSTAIAATYAGDSDIGGSSATLRQVVQ